MAETSKRMKGTGRVTFIAHRDTITAELEAGWPMKAVHARLADKLGISYPQFARYVYALIRPPGQSAAPQPTATTRAAKKPPAAASLSPPKPTPPTNQEGPPAHARREPASRGFNHDPIERPDDRRRLLGEE